MLDLDPEALPPMSKSWRNKSILVFELMFSWKSDSGRSEKVAQSSFTPLLSIIAGYSFLKGSRAKHVDLS